MDNNIYDSIIEEIVNDEVPVLIYIYSSKFMVDPNTLEFFKNLKETEDKNTVVYLVDIDVHSETLSEFEITTVPVIICFKNKKEYFRFTGTQSKVQLKTILSFVY